jgi:hypothetical protein
MSGKSDTFEDGVLQLLFNATAISQIADNAASSAATDLWVALHTADPTDSGTQGSNEASYTGYARVATTRSTSTGGWTVSSGVASPVSAITFGSATSTSTSTITHFSVGLTSDTTDGVMYYLGTVTPNINIGSGVTARLTTESSITED